MGQMERRGGCLRRKLWILVVFCGVWYGWLWTGVGVRVRDGRSGEVGRVLGNGEVCGWDGVSYKSRHEALEKGVGVMHASACGACSNAHDVGLYRNTRMTLTRSATGCAVVYRLFGKAMATKCMQVVVPFTRPCQTCWVDNIQCTNEKCSHACKFHVLRSLLTGRKIAQPLDDGSLNPCLACDEQECGPAFRKCAGANRRRCSISTDIPRFADEFYTEADVH